MSDHPILGPEKPTPDWTTNEELAAFMQWAGEQEGVQLSSLGQSQEGRDLPLVTIGAGDEPGLYVNALIHGHEYAASEVALLLIRDIITGEMPIPASLLERTTIAVAPRMNPDGWETGSQNTVDGTNPNRDLLALSTPEIRSFYTGIRLQEPSLVLDLHEYGSTVGQGHDYLSTNAKHPAGHSLTRDMGEQAHLEGLSAVASMDEGYSTMEWPDDGKGYFITSASHLSHAASVLIESHRRIDMEDRLHFYPFAVRATINHFIDNYDQYVDAHQASLDAATSGPLRMTTVLDGADHVLDIEGYSVPEGVPQAHIDVLGLVVENDGTWIPMRQPAKGLLPPLFDPLSSDRVATGQRVYPDSPPGEDSGMEAVFQDGGFRYRVDSMWIVEDGFRQQLTLGG